MDLEYKDTGMSLKKLARDIGKNEDYFYIMKNNSPEKFNFIFKTDNYIDDYYKYIDYIYNLKNKVIEFYYSFDKPIEFGKILIEHNISNSNPSAAAYETSKQIFSSDSDMNYNTMIKLEKIIKIYEEVKNIKDNK